MSLAVELAGVNGLAEPAGLAVLPRPTPVDRPRLLAVGRVRLPGDVCDANGRVRPAWRATLRRAAGAERAGRHLRDLSRGGDVDLVLVGPRLDGRIDAWQFVARLRNARPWQAWALLAAAGEVTPRGERYALTLGASGVFDGERDFDRLLDLAAALRRGH